MKYVRTNVWPTGYYSEWFIGTPGTTYEFRVVGKDTSGNSAEASTTTTIATGCTVDAYEKNNDGQKTGASALVIGQPQEHNFCANDVDWAIFDGVAGKTYFIAAESLSGGATIKLELQDSSGTTLLPVSVSPGLGKPAAIVWKPTSSGKYYLMVTSVLPEVAGTDVRYSLTTIDDPTINYFPLVGR